MCDDLNSSRTARKAREIAVEAAEGLREHSRASIYNEIASHYWKTFEDPLYAADEWLDPIIEQVTIAIDSGAYEIDQSAARTAEIIDRVACVVAVVTHGRSVLRGIA